MKMLPLGLTLLLGGYGIGVWLLTLSGTPPRVDESLWDCGLVVFGVGLGYALAWVQLFLNKRQSAATARKEPGRALDL